MERYIEIPIPAQNTLSASDQSKTSAELSFVSANPNFDSRFLSDFDMIQCLGKGGFGVVFEAKNKLDDCRYAVKRIMLPAKKENRDRVMREVKTLANCEHQNIVRFFQAWVEQPPAGWQEDQDRFWLSHQDSIMSTSIDIESTTGAGGGTVGGVSRIYHERLAVSPGRGIYTELNTNECLNLDEELVRKTSFLPSSDGGGYGNGVAAPGAEWRGRVNDNSDSFIEFRHSTNNHNDHDFDDNLDDAEEDEDDDEDESDDSSDSGTGPNHYSGGAGLDGTSEEGSNSVFNHSTGSKQQGKKRYRSISLDPSSKDAHKGAKMYLYIQMQLCQKDSLKEWLQVTPLAERQLKIVSIFDQIVKAVEYVHLKGLIHRDLKPSNIFFALDGTVKVGDFGLVTDMEDCPDSPEDAAGRQGGDGGWNSRTQVKKHTQQVGTHLYMSPEQLNGGQYDYKVDIYSLGLILFELLVAFSTEMERIKALTSLRQSNFPPEYLPAYEGELDLLKMMLSVRPQERPTTFGIRARPPLNQLDQNGGGGGENKEFHFELPSRRKDSKSVS